MKNKDEVSVTLTCGTLIRHCSRCAAGSSLAAPAPRPTEQPGGVWDPVCLPLQEGKATLLCCVLRPFAKEEMLLSLIYASAHPSGMAAAAGPCAQGHWRAGVGFLGAPRVRAGRHLPRKDVSSSLELSVAISRDRGRLLGTRVSDVVALFLCVLCVPLGLCRVSL